MGDQVQVVLGTKGIPLELRGQRGTITSVGGTIAESSKSIRNGHSANTPDQVYLMVRSMFTRSWMVREPWLEPNHQPNE
ncbi:MAG: hypothetical protein EXR67_05685 [Dehalococcoidia bacterium]|nr:hypothetical protein [Dehalococcoidia bacterium]